MNFLPRGENPHGRKENSNTIYGSDPAHGSDAGAVAHSGREGKEVREDGSGRPQVSITCMAFM